MGVEIRRYQPEDNEGIAAVYRECFSQMEPQSLESSIQNTLEALEKSVSRAAIAYDNQVLGFLTYSMSTNMHPEAQRELSCLLKAASEDPDSSNELVGRLLLNEDGYGGEFVIERFKKYTPPPEGINAFIYQFGVREENRRNGIGEKLTNAALEMMKKEGATVAYAYLIDGSPAVGLAEKLGFEKIIKVGPFYKNGQATIVVGREL